MKKRLMAFVLTLVMVFSMAACGGTGASGISSKEGVYKVEDIEQRFGAEEDDYLGISQMRVVDDTIYAVVDISFQNGSRSKYVAMDMKGNVLKEMVLNEQIYATVDTEKAEFENMVTSTIVAAETTEVVVEDSAVEGEEVYVDDIETSSYISTHHIMEDGRLAYVKTTDVNDFALEEFYTKNELIITDIDGKNELRVALTGLPEENNYFYANCMVPLEDDTMCLLSYDHGFMIDLTEGTAEYFMPTETMQNVYSVPFFKDGKPVVALWDEEYTKQTYSVVDLATGDIIEELDIPAEFSDYTFSEGGESGYDLLLINNNAVYGYNLGDTDKTLLMDYLNSDLATYQLRNVSFVDGETFFAMYNDIVDYETHFAKFTLIPPNKVPDKDIITVAASSIDNTMKKEVIEFNKTSDDYRVVVKDYSEYNTLEDYKAGDKQLEMDIMSGLIPDIIVCDSDFAIAKYADKDLFVDFYELLAEDKDLKVEDFCENVFKAFETEGKLYQFPVSFDIMTVMGKASIFGNDTSLTWDELNAVLAQYPKAKAFSETTQYDILNFGLLFSYGQLVDEMTGECYFDSDLFKGLLEFAKQYPEEINWETMYDDDEFWMDYETQYVADRTLLTMQNIYSVYDGWMQGYRTYGEKATPVGYPTTEGNGSRISCPLSFVICNESKVVDGAWNFVKRFVSEEAQMPQEKNPHYSATGRLPVLKSALEACANGIATKPSYIGVDGNRVEYDEYIYINNEQVKVEPGTEEDVKMWLDYILSIDKKATSNFEEALEIITEDAAGYFNGSKSIDEVISVIQSRMTILVNEDR